MTTISITAAILLAVALGLSLIAHRGKNKELAWMGWRNHKLRRDLSMIREGGRRGDYRIEQTDAAYVVVMSVCSYIDRPNTVEIKRFAFGDDRDFARREAEELCDTLNS